MISRSFRMIRGMDAIDEQIVGLLVENARSSYSELGRQVGLGTNAAAARVRRLEREGVIVGYTAVTSRDTPGRPGGLEVFIDVRLDRDTDDDAFEKAVAPIRQIVDAAHVTGPYDFLLHVYVADTAALDSLLRRLKRSCGAAQTQTRVALRGQPSRHAASR